MPWLGPVIAAAWLAAMTVVNPREPAPPVRGFGDQIMMFAHDARATIEEQPARIVFWNAGASHLQAMLGASDTDPPHLARRRSLSPSPTPVFADEHEESPSENDHSAALRQRILDDGEPFWLVEGLPGGKEMTFAQWLETERVIARVRPVASSAMLPRNDDWPEQVTLSWVEPVVAR